MTSTRPSLLKIAAAALLCVASAANATITVVTTGTVAAFNATTGGSIDSFNDLGTSLGATSGALPASLSRNVSGLTYALSSTISDIDASSLYLVPATGTLAVSTNLTADSLVLSGFAQPVYALGGNFFRTGTDLGELASGSVKVVATDVNGASVSQTLAGGSLTSFVGFRSDVALSSVVVSLSAASTTNAVTLDNISISAVPETSTWLMMALGLSGLMVLRRRA